MYETPAGSGGTTVSPDVFNPQPMTEPSERSARAW
jgi:hypothetical protein